MATIIVYGYDKPEAEQLQQALSSLLSTDIALLSASTMENATVNDVIMKCPNEVFLSHPFKVLVFVDIDDAGIHKTVHGFPAEVKRPVFCGLTDENVHWPFGHLLAHLMEEYRLWQSKKKHRPSESSE